MKKLIIICNTILAMAVFDGCGNASVQNPVSEVVQETEITVEAEPTMEVTKTIEQPTNEPTKEPAQEMENVSKPEATTAPEGDNIESWTEDNQQEITQGEVNVTEPASKVESTFQNQAVTLEPGGLDDTDEADEYVGEYKDYDNDETNLWIRKNEDGTYDIDIGIFRVTTFDGCDGTLTDKGLEFTTKRDEQTIYGVITINDDIATVTFLDSNLTLITSGSEYKYHR